MKKNARILVELSPGIGDLIMLTPALRSIKEQYPDVKLTVASRSRNSLKAIERLSYIDEVCAIPKKGATFAQKLRAMRIVAKQDYVLFVSYILFYYWIAKIFCVPYRVGQCKEKYKKFGLLTKYHPYGKHDPQYFRAQCLADKLAKDLEIDLSIDKQCDVSLPTMEEEKSALEKMQGKVKNNIIKNRYIAFSPFGNSDISIPYQLTFKIIQYILENYNYKCVIVDAKSHSEFDKINNSRVINMCGKTSMMEMIAILNNSTAVVAADTGTLHISCALKKPSVGIFAVCTPEQWAPRTYCHPVSLNLPCVNCGKDGIQHCQHHRCMNDITPVMVINELEKCIQEAN